VDPRYKLAAPRRAFFWPAFVARILTPQQPRCSMQTMPQCTGDWSPFAGRRPALGHRVPGPRPARPALGHAVPDRRPARPALGPGVPAAGRHWGTECPAEGWHWPLPALGARRSAGLPAEGRRWLGRRPGTAARAVCARRSEQCAVYGARLSSMLYILLCTGIKNIRDRESPKIVYTIACVLYLKN